MKKYILCFHNHHNRKTKAWLQTTVFATHFCMNNFYNKQYHDFDSKKILNIQTDTSVSNIFEDLELIFNKLTPYIILKQFELFTQKVWESAIAGSLIRRLRAASSNATRRWGGTHDDIRSGHHLFQITPVYHVSLGVTFAGATESLRRDAGRACPRGRPSANPTRR